jgi:hypothetical protein
MPLSGAVGRDVPRQCGALAATPWGDARTMAGTWAREGTGRERQSGAVRVSCEELTSRDGAGGTPAPRPEDGRATGRGLASGDGAGVTMSSIASLAQSASPTGAKEAEEHEQKWRSTQGVAPPSASSLALGWYASRFQRSNAAGTAALPGYLPPGRRRSQESNQSPISPRRRESIPTVQFVSTVQSMGSCS